MLQALIFDVDGTLADTETAHLSAFNHAFAELGLNWHWDLALYTQLLQVSGGKERIKAWWYSQADRPQVLDATAMEQTIDRIHEIKTAAYEQAVQDGQVQMRPGVLALLSSAAEAGLRLAIATTTSPVNIAALLRRAIGADWRYHFAVVEDASTAPRKKPDPMVYRQTLEHLRLPASDCLAFEDSGNGLKAAMGAGLATIVTPNQFTIDHDFSGALKILPSLEGVSPAMIKAWHSESAQATRS
jgi:HAD superfamily hydrolase (TIGR01509 family)